MAVPVQAGTDVVLGFGGLVWTGYVAEDGLSWKRAFDANEIIKDQNGATRTKIRMDEYDELSGSFILDDSGATATIANAVPTEGDVFDINTPDDATDTPPPKTYFEVMEATVAMAAGAAKLTVTLRKEASMDYTPA